MNNQVTVRNNDSKTCRICFDNDNPTDFISPCLCTGGSAYVHRKCLDNWRSVNENGRAFTYCDVCQFEYAIEPVVDDPSADRKRLLIFRLLVTRDITLIILLVQAIIIGMTFLVQVADKKNNEIKNLYPTSMSSFGIYYLSSLILFFALLGVFGLIGFCCGLTSNDHNDRCSCAFYSSFCLSTNCNGCDGNHNCGREGAGILMVIVLIFAILGVFVGIILSGIIIRKVIKQHTNKLWLRQETKKYIVKDFQGRRNELTSRPARHPMAELSIQTVTDNDRTDKTLSAPIQLLPLTAYNT
jgi:hypothetical protein